MLQISWTVQNFKVKNLTFNLLSELGPFWTNTQLELVAGGERADSR